MGCWIRFSIIYQLDIKWMNEFVWQMALISPFARIDGFTWHGYPLGAGKDIKVDEQIMDPDFGQKIAARADEIQLAYWANIMESGIWMGETGGPGFGKVDSIIRVHFQIG